MSTQPVSAEQVESTRKNGARIQGEVLRRLAEVTQDRAADFMGTSASTISRAKNDLEQMCQLLAALGFQLSPSNAMVISRQELFAMKTMLAKYLQAEVENQNRSL
ncbi:MarR family transcriptional regulator [Achromobacter sp. K91]|uniref:CII family transcriptional regulator n=1 Tax=unclassified Achromobacter TaxID=2626865 RepID=UPI000E66C747|nr:MULTISPECIES: CII family transcriptional regulator [unclassified Achromobacter]MBD9417638.1 MarR family transcriptional regulator [Achromobacter sp. ACM04]RIJ02190.1 MarR family transcriptional regulator [Achromobacter sp. K91]